MESLLFLTIYLMPWFMAAALAAVFTWTLAKSNKLYFSLFAVGIVGLCGFFTQFIVPQRTQQIDSLHFEEAINFCNDPATHVLKPLPATEQIKFGVYDSYLSPAKFEDLEKALRMRQTFPDSRFRNVVFVPLKRGEQPANDVFPILRHGSKGSVNLSVIDPRTGAIMGYSNFLLGHGGPRYYSTQYSYVGCNRGLAGFGPTSLDTDELFALLGALIPQTNTPTLFSEKSAHIRKYDVELDSVNEIRDDCSKGISIVPELDRNMNILIKRDEGDLVILVRPEKTPQQSRAREQKLMAMHRYPILWQEYKPVLTCKNYFSDESKAGPIFHANGYVEPVSRVRALGSDPYFPFDYGPHRILSCKDTIKFSNAPYWDYTLKREGSNLVIANLRDVFDKVTVTPLITCRDYFSNPSQAPDVLLFNDGTSMPGKNHRIAASRILDLQDEEYLLQRTIRHSLADIGFLSTPVTIPESRPTSKHAVTVHKSENPWPATPRAAAN